MIFGDGRDAWGFTPEERREYWRSDLIVAALGVAVVLICSWAW